MIKICNHVQKKKKKESLNFNSCNNRENPADGGKRPQCETSAGHFLQLWT